jgi:hypothetical protein
MGREKGFTDRYYEPILMSYSPDLRQELYNIPYGTGCRLGGQSCHLCSLPDCSLRSKWCVSSNVAFRNTNKY